MTSKNSAAAPRESGRFAYEGLDRTIHERARLGILASLTAYPKGLPFNDLKELCSLTDGNLARHLQTLEEAGLISVVKSAKSKRPQTHYQLTAGGRKQLAAYLDQLEQVIADAAMLKAAAGRRVDVVRGAGLSTS